MNKVRAFISITIPEFGSISNIQNTLKGSPGLRISRDIHITMKFLGDTDLKKIELLKERMNILSSHEPFNIDLKGLGAFPNARSPKVVWIGVHSNEVLENIADQITTMLDSLSVNYDDKPFKGHVTVARVNYSDPGLSKVIDSHQDTEFGSFTCSEIKIMKSDLTPKGAVHSVLETVKLSGL